MWQIKAVIRARKYIVSKVFLSRRVLIRKA